MQDRGQTPSTLRDFIAANPVAIISICLTVVSIIISVLSYKVSKQNYKINEQNNKDLILYTEIGDSIAEDECYISVYAIYYTINSQIAVDYMIMPSFVNSNDKAIQNVNFRIILRFIQGFSFNNHLLLNHDFDTLISWNQDYEAKFSDGKQYSLHLPPYHNYGVFQYKKNLITAYDGVGGYGLIDAMRIPMEELFLEMDFLLTYDKQPHPIRIPYRFFYSSEANQNYFEFRDSMMQICYNDYSYRLKRLNVDRKKTRCYVIINDTIVVVNDPEFFNVKSDNHEPILVRSSKYPLAVLDKPKTESSSFSFWDWFHIILLIMGIIFTLVYALFLTFIMHEKFIKSEELNLSLKETIELVFFWFFSICVTFFNIHILFVYFS